MRRQGLFETSVVDLPEILCEATDWATEFLVFMRCKRDDGLVGEVSRIRKESEGSGSGRQELTRKQTVNHGHRVIQCADQLPPVMGCLALIEDEFRKNLQL